MKKLLTICLVLCAAIVYAGSSDADRAEATGCCCLDRILGFDIGDTIEALDSSLYIGEIRVPYIYDNQGLFRVKKNGREFIVGQSRFSATNNKVIATLIISRDSSALIHGFRIGDVVEDTALLRNPENRVFHQPRRIGQYPFSASGLSGRNDTIIYVSLGDRWFARMNKADRVIDHFEKNYGWGYYKYEYER